MGWGINNSGQEESKAFVQNLSIMFFLLIVIPEWFPAVLGFIGWVVTVVGWQILCIEESKSITFLVSCWNQGLTFRQLTGRSLGHECHYFSSKPP